MCDVLEPASVWREAKPKARKDHACAAGCGRPIKAGETYVRIEMLHAGSWVRMAAHAACDSIASFVAFDICGQDVYSPTDVREKVREHMEEEPDLLRMWRDHLRERNRLERLAS